jgi:flagellar FliJ protein
MSTPGALDLLIDLASRQSDARTRDLGHALRNETSEGKRLALLRDYRTTYLGTLAQAQRRGLSSGMLINYNRFLTKLDAAIEQQEAIVAAAKGHTEAARTKLNEAERKRKSLVTISDRRAAAARVAEGRREQKQHDEISNRLASYGNGVTKPIRIASELSLRGASSLSQTQPLPIVKTPVKKKT